MKLVWYLGITLIVVVVLLLLFVFSGKYNVSAMQHQFKLTQWLLSTTTDKSVKQHAADIRVPNLNNNSMIKMGLLNYNEMCSDCHGAPGIKPSELAKGLNPKAPVLTEAYKRWTPAELFWIIKYGIRMTGMPAWGVTQPDQKIWTIVAFIEKLQSVSDDNYKKSIRPGRILYGSE